MSLWMLLAALAAPERTGAVPSEANFGSTVAQVRSFAATTGDTLWSGYGAAPFGFLLLEKDKEILLCQPGEPEGFTAEGVDSASGCQRFSRPRTQFPGTFLAAMPMLGPPATIVMGTPASTGRTRAAWLRTILHEHFHQWQWSQPNHYARVDALDLKGGDETGMWMLNFPFPYENERVSRAYSDASRSLADALELRGKPGFVAAFGKYMRARGEFARSVSPREWRYLDFQLWQEGTARWSEIQLGKMYPDAGVSDSASALEKSTLAALRKPNLKEQKRELAYAFGGGEAMLMAACGPQWRAAYPSVLSHSELLNIARRACVKL
jgi:hypothetical protein